MTFEEILAHFPGPRKPNGQGGYMVPCSTGHDKKTPSLSISPGNGAGPLFHCFGCGQEAHAIIRAAGLTWPDILPPRETSARRPAPRKVSLAITIDDLARHKALPVDFLRSLGIENRPNMGGLVIPYRLEDGSLADRQRLRTALVGKEGSRWLPGKGSPVPYGLDHLEDAQERGFLLLVEGETDAVTLWLHGYPALGIPGADMAGKLEAEHVTGLDRIFYWREPDRGGDTFAAKIPARLREIKFHGEIREIRIDGVKDPNELHMRDPAGFDAAFGKAIDEARKIEEPGARTELYKATVGTDPVPAKIPDFERFPLTDAGNAEILAARYGEDLRYDHARKRWLYFYEHRWREDGDGTIVRLALESARARFHAATAAKGNRESIAKWAIRSENRDRIAATLSLAVALPPIADRGEGWDGAPFLLCVPNGVVDLRTGDLRSGQRSDRITMCTEAEYEAEARAPRFLTFLDEVFRGDIELIDFINRAVGYTACGIVSEEVFFLLYGEGANGKSKFLTALRSALGDYAGEVSFLTFEKAKRTSGEATPDLAELPGRRLVTASEGTDGVRWDERRVKVLTGRDPVKARALYKDIITFRPACVFWLSSNHKPRVHDETEAFWRRIHLIPFTRYFVPHERDPNLEEKLLSEKAGILKWVVQGALEWQRLGLAPPNAVSNATATYRAEEDPLRDFIEDRCIFGPTLKAGAGELYEAYKCWAEMNGETALKQKAFSQRLGKKQLKPDRGHGGKRIWVGISLRGDA